jgi:acylphosphatase
MRATRRKQPGASAPPLESLPQIVPPKLAPCFCRAQRSKAVPCHATVSATISKFVTDAKQARRYFVSGFVQGVGFRHFTQGEAHRLNLSGYALNLRDGRVEAYAIGTPAQLAKFRAALDRGPRFSNVSDVKEEPAAIDRQYENEFVTTHED